MSWCDKLASTPSVGVMLDNFFIPSDALLQAFAPLFNELIDEDDGHQQFSIDKRDTFSVSFGLEEGFTYGLENSKVFVAFNHRMRCGNERFTSYFACQA